MPRPLPLWKKVLYSTIICTVILLLFESILWLCGVRMVLDGEDPSRGFSGLVSVFQRKGEVFRTHQTAPYATFNDQAFLAGKPPNGVRLFTLGGSSSYGFPWGGHVAFTAILGDVLAAAHTDRRIEAVNVSGISYAMHRLSIVADEIIGYEPDIFIIYSGHNEFIERSFYTELKRRERWLDRLEHVLSHLRIYSALRDLLTGHQRSETSRFEMFVRRESVLYTEQQKQTIIDEYREGLRRIVRLAHERGTKVVLATIPCNLQGWRPQKSILPAELDNEQLALWSQAFQSGKEKLETARFDLAVSDFKRALQIAPAYCETHYLLGRTYEGLLRWDDARLAYQQACDCDASPVRRLSGINQAVRTVAKEEDALLVDLDRVFHQQTEHGLIGFDLIEDYVHPTLEGHQIIAWHLWQALERTGWLGEENKPRRELFEQIVANRPAGSVSLNATWFYNQGCVLFNQGRKEQAIEKFRQALEIAPHLGALGNLAMLLADRGQHEQAIKPLEQLLRMDPDNVEARNNLGRVLLTQGKVVEAITQFRRVLGLQPDSVDAHVGLGVALSSRGELQEAVQHYRQALKIDPTSADAHANLGTEYRTQGNLDQAVEHWRRALSVKPDYSYAHFNLGTAYLALGQLEEAAGHLRRTLQLDPDLAPAHTSLGLILQRQGALEEAADHCRRALEIEPDDADATYLLGRVFDSQGKTDLAINQYRKALQYDPDSADFHNSLGLALGFRNQLDEAIRHFRIALQLRPDHGEARDNLGAALRGRDRLDRRRRQ